MSFPFHIFSAGGGSLSINGIAKYPNAAALPGSANDGDVAIVLDTNNLYSYDSGVAGWVIVGGPGVAITVSDSSSVDLTLTLNVLTADLRIAGATTLPANYSGVTSQIYAGSTPGLVSFVPGFRVGEVTSSVLQFTGNSFPVLGTSFGIQVNQASGSTPGYLSTADFAIFSAKVGISAIIQTVFPILGGTNLPSSGGITLSIPVANGTTGGYLSATDWTTFNNKLSVGSTIAQLGNIAANTILGNNTVGAAPILALTVAQTKAMLGVSLNNFGDVTIGAFSYAGIAGGATISAAQSLQLCWGDTSNPGLVGTTHQVWSGNKRTTGHLGTDGFLQFWGASLISIGTTNITAGYTLLMPIAQGGTFTMIVNDGFGNLAFKSFGLMTGYRVVTNAGATLNLQDRMVEITTGSTNQTLNIGWGTGATGTPISIMKIDSGLGSVTVQSDRLINGVTNFTFSSQWEAHSLVDNGIGLRVLT